MRTIKLIILGAFLTINFAGLAQDKVTTVKLEQVPGKFNKKKINIKAGTYIFEVSNKNVDHQVGFVLAPKQDNITADDHIKEAYLKNVVGEGETATSNQVTLTPGEYVYFCPMNPTPQYTLVVK